MHPRRRVPSREMRNVTASNQQSVIEKFPTVEKTKSTLIILVSLRSVLARLSSLISDDPVFDLGAIRGQLPTSTHLGRPASTGVHRDSSRTGRRHTGHTPPTPPSRRHGADLCHPRATRPLTLSWTRPIGACESPPIALRGRHRARIKIFDFS